jgi:hypothetical protein
MMTLDEAFALARIHQSAGRLAEAEGLYRAILATRPDLAVVRFCLGAVLRAQGRTAEALTELCAAMALAEEQGADIALKDGISKEIAPILMPGEIYHQVLGKIHERVRPRGYLEIGVCEGESLQWVRPPTVCIGVDPHPAVRYALAVQPHLYKTTSDAFFAEGLLGKHHPGLPLDLAFIDGLHAFHQVLLDFLHVEAHSHRGGRILIHDVFPPTRWVATPEYNGGGYWAGDGWKLCVVLRRWRPDLRFSVIATLPTGLAVVVGLDPANTVLRDHFSSILSWAAGLEFSALWDDRETVLQLTPGFDEAAARLGLAPAETAQP